MPRRVLLIGHEATRTGAPIVLLRLAQWLRAHTDLALDVALYTGGPLVAEFAAVAPTVVLHDRHALPAWLGRLADRWSPFRRVASWVNRWITWPQTLCGEYDLVYANTVACAPCVRVAQRNCRRPLLLHVHELENAIAVFGGPRMMRSLAPYVDHYLAAGDDVANNLLATHHVPAERLSVINEFISVTDTLAVAAARVPREALAAPVPRDAWLVGGCGTYGRRKGPDLLFDAAARMPAAVAGRPVHFVWIGQPDDAAFAADVAERCRASGLADRFHVLPARPGVAASLAALDVFALPSREDPMPLVAIEAATLRRPVVCFAGAGAIPGVLRDGCVAVPAFDTTAYADALVALLENDARRAAVGDAGHARVRSACDVDTCAPLIYERMLSMIAGPHA